jgi:SAM-dependent methyltransferase
MTNDTGQMSHERACEICGARDADPLSPYSRDGWIVGKCRECAFVYLVNPPGHDALSEDFAWENSIGAEERRRKNAAPLLYGFDYATRFRTGLFQRTDMQKYQAWFGGGNVLDVGCAFGTHIKSPFIPYGIEVSRALAEKADQTMRARGGYCVHGPGSEAIWQFPEAHFDAIVMRSYLEHEERARRVLEGAHRALKPSGKIYVKVPNYGSLNRQVTGRNWCGFRLPDHVNYFTLTSLKRLTSDLGFTFDLKNPLNLFVDDKIHALLSKRVA